ncbi:hypothetical protein [Aliamphritea hakodatensis]|uniref:hypothetical protein n=1 Tax=Aliamphritea hakodatensis TaxID=2895352 RepID=UPI0022FD772A|nr:hypothetical protein [Aliamphritea hakodatensis]
MNSVAAESLGSDIHQETQSLLSALQILCQILQLTDDPHTFERSAQSALSEAPEKAFTSLGERVFRFSCSLRQRIAIAGALVADPKIFVFDETTSALDYEAEQTTLKKTARNRKRKNRHYDRPPAELYAAM